MHPTTKIEEGSSRRNIARKKTDAASLSGTGRYDNRNKRMGGTGKGMRADDDPIAHALSYGGKGNGGNGTDSDHGSGAVGALNVDDPLYVPEEDDDPRSYVLSSGGCGGDVDGATIAGQYETTIVRPVYGPLLTLSEFKIRCSDIVREYFDSSDISEVIRCVIELGCRQYHSELIKRAMSLGMDEGPRERELISRLLACLHPNPLTDEEMEGGFELVLDSIEDLCIDIPDAKVRERRKRERMREGEMRFFFSCRNGEWMNGYLFTSPPSRYLSDVQDSIWFLFLRAITTDSPPSLNLPPPAGAAPPGCIHRGGRGQLGGHGGGHHHGLPADG
jgi:hypothetical protein